MRKRGIPDTSTEWGPDHNQGSLITGEERRETCGPRTARIWWGGKGTIEERQKVRRDSSSLSSPSSEGRGEDELVRKTGGGP